MLRAYFKMADSSGRASGSKYFTCYPKQNCQVVQCNMPRSVRFRFALTSVKFLPNFENLQINVSSGTEHCLNRTSCSNTCTWLVYQYMEECKEVGACVGNDCFPELVKAHQDFKVSFRYN